MHIYGYVFIYDKYIYNKYRDTCILTYNVSGNIIYDNDVTNYQLHRSCPKIFLFNVDIIGIKCHYAFWFVALFFLYLSIFALDACMYFNVRLYVCTHETK